MPTIDFYEFDTVIMKLEAKNIHKLWEQTHIVWLVEYYASWCGPCRLTRVAYRKAARKLADRTGKKVRVAAVNCFQNNDICNQAGIQSYPQIYLYPKGQQGQPQRPAPLLMHEQEKTVDNIIDFVDMFQTNEVIEVAVEGKLSYESAVVQADRPVVVVYGQPWCGPCQMLDGSTREFAKKAKAYAVAAHVDCNAHKALCDAHGVTTVPVVALYIPGKSSTPVGEILWPPTNQMIQAAPQYTLSMLQQTLPLFVSAKETESSESSENGESSESSEDREEL